MGLSPSNSHHRRRSSVLTSTAGSSHAAALDQRDDPSRLTGDGLGYKRDDLKVGEDPDVSDLSSIAESVEMDHISSDDDIQDDEETGLTARQRRQRRRRRQQRRQLDARIAGVKASKTDDLAGQSVTQRLLINATLILMWYFFSLAISIVSSDAPFPGLGLRAAAGGKANALDSTTSGCSPKMTSSFPTLSSPRVCICWFSSRSPRPSFGSSPPYGQRLPLRPMARNPNPS